MFDFDDFDWLDETNEALDLNELSKFADSLSEKAMELEAEDKAVEMVGTNAEKLESTRDTDMVCTLDASLPLEDKQEPMHSNAIDLHSDIIIINVPSADDLTIEDAIEEVITVEEHCDAMFQPENCSSSDESYSEVDAHSDLGYESLDSPGSDNSSLQVLFPELL